MISWLAVLLPVLGVVLLDLPIILGFILAGIWALLFTENCAEVIKKSVVNLRNYLQMVQSTSHQWSVS